MKTSSRIGLEGRQLLDESMIISRSGGGGCVADSRVRWVGDDGSTNSASCSGDRQE